ncbi:MAG: HEPN domain-containing protein [Lewinellaceae bacterium]|nr:HEPN domain-containing protein [Phaeodactylibacter sp.]MCB9041008.1 HEPN domain-containing protein [Lewinellaceae bacterium]
MKWFRQCLTAQNPHDWITKAERDLELARDAFQMNKDYWDLICYHCQQATEKFFLSLPHPL